MNRPLVLVSAFLLLVAANANANAAMVLHYQFDNNSAQDISGNNRHGTVVGSPAFITGQDPAGKAISFNNPRGATAAQPATQFVTIPDLTSVLGNSSFTVSIKYKSTATDSGGRLFGNTWVGSGIAFNFMTGTGTTVTRPSPNALLLPSGSGGNYSLVGEFGAGGTPVTTNGHWWRAVMTVERGSGGTLSTKLYLTDLDTNTQYVKTGDAAASGLGSISFANLALGALGATANSENTSAAVATVDDFQMFNTALSAAQVAAISDVPEPATWILCLSGLAALAFWRSRKACRR